MTTSSRGANHAQPCGQAPGVGNVLGNHTARGFYTVQRLLLRLRWVPLPEEVFDGRQYPLDVIPARTLDESNVAPRIETAGARCLKRFAHPPGRLGLWYRR